jgi:hypothetical protein
VSTATTTFSKTSWKRLLIVGNFGSLPNRPFCQAASAFPASSRDCGNEAPETCYRLCPNFNPFYGLISNGGLAQPTVTYNRLLRPFSQYGSVNLIGRNAGDSTYNSFQLKLEKRFGAKWEARIPKSFTTSRVSGPFATRRAGEGVRQVQVQYVTGDQPLVRFAHITTASTFTTQHCDLLVKLRKIFDGLFDAVVGDIVRGRLSAQVEVVAHVLLDESVAVDVARRFGGVSRRAIEKAARKGSLHVNGKRLNRRISLQSLLKYFPPENMRTDAN